MNWRIHHRPTMTHRPDGTVDTHNTCVCSTLPTHCRGSTHECVCSTPAGPEHCRGSKHVCWCPHLEDGSRRCRGAVHECICGTDVGLNCGAEDHMCICIVAAEECIGSAHVCCCLVCSYCRSDHHQCICDVGDSGPDRCRGTDHPCMCATLQGSRKNCLAEKDAHECTCNMFRFFHSSDNCRGAGPHVCSCSLCGPDRCRGTEQHWCVCRDKYNKCLAAEGTHDCSCLTREPGKCLSDDRHQCVCAHGEPYEASPPTWRSCRRWGEHDDPRVEARGVRALVVASHGSAPNAEISSPVLRGFADLPYQLRLHVVEIAWTVAAAGF